MEIQGLDQLRRKLKRLEDFQNALHDPMEESLALMQDYISRQFPVKKGAFMAHATEKQKRWWFWALKNDPRVMANTGRGFYKRDGNTRAWTFEIRRNSNGLQGVLGNVKSEMRYVQGDRQQPFHKATGWRTTEETIDKNRDKVQRKFQDHIRRELNK